MGGKKGGGGAAPKGKAAQKTQKVIEDKTFGMKNKNKSKKVQQYVNTVQKQAEVEDKKKNPGVKTKKDLKAEKAAEFNEIFTPVQAKKPQQNFERGADPKTILCEYFRNGTCNKGAKCRFSHDNSLLRKDTKVDLYTDRRAEETNESWDDDTLRDVVTKKHAAGEGRKVASQIVCKHFLEAVESRKYGWFWECPNGGEKCHYRHALPPGFVLNRDKKKDEDDENKVYEEDLLEEERRGLTGGTPMTEELFLKWKAQRRTKLEEERAARRSGTAAKAEASAKKDRNAVGMSGRRLFEFKPEMFVDDESAVDSTITRSRINKEDMDNEATGGNASGSGRDQEKGEQEKEGGGEAGGTENAGGENDEDVPIDEALFADDLAEDLDDLNFDDEE